MGPTRVNLVPNPPSCPQPWQPTMFNFKINFLRLATFIAGYELFQIEVNKTYGISSWRSDLKKVWTQLLCNKFFWKRFELNCCVISFSKKGLNSKNYKAGPFCLEKIVPEIFLMLRIKRAPYIWLWMFHLWSWTILIELFIIIVIASNPVFCICKFVIFFCCWLATWVKDFSWGLLGLNNGWTERQIRKWELQLVNIPTMVNEV